MSLTPADRKWLRRVLREVVREVVTEELDARERGMTQIGGYSPVDVPDEAGAWVERREARGPIGFHRQGSNVTQ